MRDLRRVASDEDSVGRGIKCLPEEKKKKICRKITGLILCYGLGYACCCSLFYPDWFRAYRKKSPYANCPFLS
jgi:hypothetical protein